MIPGDKATIYIVDGDVAKRLVVPVLGEAGGTLFVDPQLKAGSPSSSKGARSSTTATR